MLMRPLVLGAGHTVCARSHIAGALPRRSADGRAFSSSSFSPASSFIVARFIEVLRSALIRDEGLDLARVSRAFANDLLPPLSCREAGCVLVTENERVRQNQTVPAV